MLERLNRILCFFAHPDDETLGMGGTLYKMSVLDKEIHVAIPGTGLSSRDRGCNIEAFRQKSLNAMAVLGIKAKNVYFGNFLDNQLDNYTLLDLIKWLEPIIEDVDPNVIFTHHRFCTNIDHQRCHEAAVVATRPSAEKRIGLFSAEILSSTGYLRPTCWEPNFYSEIFEDDLGVKIEAMKWYDSEIRKSPHPRSPEVIEALARIRGSEAGCEFAESFIMQRAFW